VVFLTLWCAFLTQNQFIDRNNVVITARTARSPASLSPYIQPAFLYFLYNLFRPETVQPLPGYSPISF